jgi:uncharacterized membrane protein
LQSSLVEVMADVGFFLEAAGVVVIVVGALTSSIAFLIHLRTWDRLTAYTTFRANFARSVLLGLEFLVAGDIIRTVVVEPTLINIATLGLLVLVRTFLSVTLEMEVSGRWPWHRPDHQPDRNV